MDYATTAFKEPGMPDFREVLFKSPYLSNVQKFYGWSDSVAKYSMEGMLATIEKLQDWRIDNMLAKDREHNLKLLHGEGGLGLEVGFGTGSLTVGARRRGLNVIGVDYTAEYIRVARELAILAGMDNKDLYQVFRQGNVEDLCFPSNHFSLVICSGVLQYVGDVLAAMREILRTLQPGGILLVDVPDYRFPYEATYNIPWVPFMKMKVAEAWLEGFEKPTRGLKYIKYISLPHCLGMMTSMGFDILDAHTTVSEAEIPSEIQNVLTGQSQDHLINDPERAYLLARKVNRDKVRAKPCSFIITAQKPRVNTSPK